MSSSRLAKLAFAAARANAHSGLDAALTIAARVAMLASPSVRPSAKAREARRMTQEKADAAVKGAFAAQAAFGGLLWKGAIGDVRGPQALAAGLAGVAEAAAKPARRTVRANARRLAGARARR